MADPKRGDKNGVMPRHRGVLKKVQEGMPIGAAMIAMNYSKKTAHTPKDITGTKSWQTLMDEYMPEDLIAARHNDLLEKRDIHVAIDKDGNITQTDRGIETAAVAKGLEMAYKLRGSFAPEKTAPSSGIVYNLFYQPVIQARVKAFEDALKDSIAHEITTSDILAPVDGKATRKPIDRSPASPSA